jgi:N-acetyl-gamma-glutamyl-phosphate reductase
MVMELTAAGVRCIDLGADFRLKMPTSTPVLDMAHAAPHAWPMPCYGLPEVYRRKIRTDQHVANPDVIPTMLFLPLVPLLQSEIIKPKGIIGGFKIRGSGAGKAQTSSLFCEVNEGSLA